ncbi:hypothetical protein C1T31_06195 [Hanstruepera neustonica]|uniref:DUF3857 domain-containing protein n=1 Tax=Hanstruepera neustonica TaxID=1445657 RepID=A0A2K1E0U5_9FLAO|nr:DUF3857 domain-containing protein [Hanstruepera neustonica]PNQ73912.1 hypothetical protein C1T31_06195 [Hanstruepera neustonica]
MSSRFFILFILCSFPFILFSQDEDVFNAYNIPLDLKNKANAVIRFNSEKLEVSDYNDVYYTNRRIITVLNEYGDSNVRALAGYNSNRIIKKMECRIYDANGNQIKKIKEKDFNDVSAVSGGTLYSENRQKYLNYTPISYPYTVDFELEVQFKSTAFLPDWMPIEGYFVSTQESHYEVVNTSGVDLKIKTLNFEDYEIEKIGDTYYKATHLSSLKPEAYAPSFRAFAPHLRLALAEFEMEGVRGSNNGWKGFGMWVNNQLLSNTSELPQSIKDEIKILTANSTTDLEKARIVYEYMQNKTRYISVQVGIGGWKPMYASDVDRLGYGDCKALTNYTKALMQEVGLESYYTIIYGDRNIVNVDKDFSATEGNHAILYLPVDGEDIWLECTSQTNPFGHIASFTDDRDALVITPDGGQVMHTRVYNANDNLLKTNAQITLDEAGNIKASVQMTSTGTQYSTHEKVLGKTDKDKDLHFKEYWDYINGLTIGDCEIINDKTKVQLSENIHVEASNYASKSGNRLLFQPNAFNRVMNAPPRYNDRKHPVEVDRGFLDIDEFEIAIPNNFEVESLQEDVNINNQFGEYTYSIKEVEPNKLMFKRKFLLKKGTYNQEHYQDFRKFWLDIIRHDKSKIALKRKQ